MSGTAGRAVQIERNMMRSRKRNVPKTFGPATRFEVNLAPAAPFKALQESRFERLKNGLLREKLDELWEPEFNTTLRRAANEAAAVSWMTAYPLLVFPALFEEKAQAALAHSERQNWILQRSRELLAV